MKDIFDAIERVSAQLSYRLERAAQKKGFAAHLSAYPLYPKPGVMVRLFQTLVHLPRGYGVNFVPRTEPEADGASWQFDIRRNDGVLRTAWARGYTMRREPEAENPDEEWVIYDWKEPLTMDRIYALMNELEKPGPSGLGLSITRHWVLRFGHMPMELAQKLEAIQSVDHLDLIYDALIDQRRRSLIEELINNPPHVHAAPVLLKYLEVNRPGGSDT